MPARTINQILTELRPTFAPQTQSLQQQAGLIPQQVASNEQALNAKEDSAFGDILNGARQRGLGFSGIPLGEQAKYTATDYLPALANLRQQGQQQAMSLQDAILGINERRDTLAQGIYQQEQDRSFQSRENALNRAAQQRASAQAAAMPSFGNLFGGMGGGQDTSANGLPKMQPRKGGGFNFQDAYGTPINAAEYVQLQNQMGSKITFRNLLQNMASHGDSGAKIALQHVGDDFKFNPNAPQNLSSLFKALGVTGNFKTTPAPSTNSNPMSYFMNQQRMY